MIPAVRARYLAKGSSQSRYDDYIIRGLWPVGWFDIVDVELRCEIGDSVHCAKSASRGSMCVRMPDVRLNISISYT
jgi:hypothetical protein